MKVLRKDYYQDDASKIKIDGFDAKKYAISLYFDNYSGHSLQLNKKADSYSTFDDGLLF